MRATHSAGRAASSASHAACCPPQLLAWPCLSSFLRTCLCPCPSNRLCPCLRSLPQRVQFLGEDGTVATVAAGEIRSCSGGSVLVVDAPLT